MTTVLVTGTGAVIGQGILQSLHGIDGLHTVATDIYPYAAGQHFADCFYTAPFTSDPAYADWLRDLVRREKVDLIIPGIEQDVSWLSNAVGTAQEPPAKLCLNTPDVVRLCSDKIAFDKVLAAAGDPCRIPSSTMGDFDSLERSLGLPFLLKPRDGYAGKGILVIHDRTQFAPVAQEVGTRYLAQKFVGSDDAEFTVSAFCVSGQIHAAIALRRLLSPTGATTWAESTSAAPFLPAMTRIAALLGAEGPTNFQFRLQDGQPLLLEINPRISSATSIRTALGYNEALMCVTHYLYGKSIEQPRLRHGRAVRYIADIVTYDDAGTDL